MFCVKFKRGLLELGAAAMRRPQPNGPSRDSGRQIAVGEPVAVALRQREANEESKLKLKIVVGATFN